MGKKFILTFLIMFFAITLSKNVYTPVLVLNPQEFEMKNY